MSRQFRETLNTGVAPMLVAKIDNNLIPSDVEGWEPILLDCFLLNSETAEKLAIEYKGERVTPTYGSKFIGAYRDKGSITGMLSRYVPVCKFELEDESQVENFCHMLDNLRKGYQVEGTTVIFEIDIVADCSYGRDNVTALFLQSIFDLKANIEGEDIYLDYQEINKLDAERIIKEEGYNMEVVIFDKEENKEVKSFGKVAILLEDYFWQPSHDNSLCCGIKDVAFSYNQAVDAIAVESPSLYQAFMNSIDKERIKEYMLCTGIHTQQVDLGINNKSVDNASTNVYTDNDEDEML